MTAPFGIEFSSPVANLSIIRDYGEGKFKVAPPKPHPAFENYIVQATDKTGIFWIKAITPVIENDAYGSATSTAKDMLESQLANRYGAGRSVDYLATGSIWNEPRDWMQGLHQNERSYYTIWETGKASLPDDIESIFLGATSVSSDSATVCIEYSSSSMKDAEAELQQALSDLL